jgi:hypothetical protein
MGFLTTVIIHNDALHTFEKHPKEFAEAIFKGIDDANYKHKQVSVSFVNGCANYIHVHPSRHADDVTVYLHYGNCVANLHGFSEDFDSLVNNNPTLAQTVVDRAKDVLKTAQKRINDIKKSK